MASVDDIGIPGQPATNLTAWQAAVRDAINTHLAARHPRSAAGVVQFTAGGTAAVTFPAGRFTAAPAVAVAGLNTPGLALAVASVTATGFTFKGPVNEYAYWIAMETG